MVGWHRTTDIPARQPPEHDRVQVPLERVGSFVEALLKGTLALMLYGSGTLVLAGVLFYFSWKLGLSTFVVLSGLLPLGTSAYLLWRLLRHRRPPRLWRYKTREAAILQLAHRSGGRLTVAEAAIGTGLTLREAEKLLNELVRKGYADLQVSPTGVLVYRWFPLTSAADKNRAEPLV